MEAGYSFTVLPAEGAEEESPRFSTEPDALVIRNSYRKAKWVADRLMADKEALDALQADFPGSRLLVLGCDTIAYLPSADSSKGVEILGKPIDREDARRMLTALSGSDHAVVSGVTLIDPFTGTERTASDLTTLVMDRLTDEMIESYLDSGAWWGKAGAFGYQDGNDWLHKKSGSESNIVGLPLELLARLLAE